VEPLKAVAATTVAMPLIRPVIAQPVARPSAITAAAKVICPVNALRAQRIRLATSAAKPVTFHVTALTHLLRVRVVAVEAVTSLRVVAPRSATSVAMLATLLETAPRPVLEVGTNAAMVVVVDTAVDSSAVKPAIRAADTAI